MRQHRFYLKSFLPSRTVVQDRDIVHQMCRVLKLRAGEEVVFWNGDGNEYLFELEKVATKDIQGRVVSSEQNGREPSVDVTLYCAILKRENFEIVCQKATEAGVFAIVPLVTERTVKTAVNEERLKKIIQEASEQSGRARIPALCDAMSFGSALRIDSENDERYFFHIAAAPTNNPSSRKMGNVIRIFIGPEGGWSDDEAEQARAAGCITMSLGPLILRAETAAIVASYMAAHAVL
jgi:16S rRNA (uracil1498-N3)-methyltransferase